MKVIENIGWYLVLLVAFVLGLKQLHEPDLWWMFRTGEWMVQNGKIPTTDVFSFTFKGTEWISVKWLFELISYGLISVAGPESISLLQSIVNVIMVILFARTVTDLAKLIYGIDLKRNQPMMVLGSLIFLFFIDYRLVGRPEMSSYLLTLTYLSMFVRYRTKPGKFIFWLIPLQIIWVNIHEGFAVGIILLLAFGFGNLLDYLITKKGDKKAIQQLLIASLLAVLAVAVNPRGFYMFYHPYFLFSVVGSNHYTKEFNSIFYRPSSYFSYKEPYFAILSFLIALFGIIKCYFKEKMNFLSKISIGYLAVIMAFLYLGTTAYRNVIFPIILVFPLAWVILFHFSNVEKYVKSVRFNFVITILLPIVFYFGIVTNYYYENFQNKDRYGLTVYSLSNPSGAANFALKNGLADKRCFSDYTTSAYFLWELRPGFESYIDLRDLDIFPPEFFDEFAQITTFTNKFEDNDAKYNYEYAMLYTWQYPNLHRYLYHSPNWQQVYADNIAAVYVKNNANNSSLIAEFKIDSTNLLGHFNYPLQQEPSRISNGISNLFWPLYEKTPMVLDSSIEASKYFRIVADFDRAEVHTQNAINNNTSPYEGWAQLGDMYLEISPYQRTNEDKIKYINMANEAYSNGVRLDKSQFGCIYGQAMCAMQTGQYGYAIKRFKKASSINKKNASTHSQIAQCYANLNQTNPNVKNNENWFKHMEIACQLEPESQNIITSLALGYCQNNQCNKAAPLLKKYNRTINTPATVHESILACMKKCGVEQ